MKKFGPMDIDFHKRCVKPNGHFDRIYYGHAAKDYDGPGADEVYDLTDTFKELSVGGRRSGNPIEEEYRQRKHIFNKRIVTDEERHQAVQGHRYDAGVGAYVREGGAGGAGRAAAPAGSAGRGGGTEDYDLTEEVSGKEAEEGQVT